jgi:hypothetical protein
MRGGPLYFSSCSFLRILFLDSETMILYTFAMLDNCANAENGAGLKDDHGPRLDRNRRAIPFINCDKKETRGANRRRGAPFRYGSD